MYAKHLPPLVRISDNAPPLDFLEYLKGVREVIQNNLSADRQRPLPDQELPSEVWECLDGICTSIDEIEFHQEADPNDDFDGILTDEEFAVVLEELFHLLNQRVQDQHLDNHFLQVVQQRL